MQLSLRLMAVAGLVTPGYVLADIGTDHAYLPISLVSEGKIPRAFAIDLRPGPLRRAGENIRAHALENRIETRLGDGLSALSPGEAQSILIAGMGGAGTIRILRDGPEVVQKARELILQPQSDLPQVRAFLGEGGWRIAQEDMVCEARNYYPMLRAIPAKTAETMNKLQLLFGPRLLEMRHPVLHQFLQKEEKTKTCILAELENGKNEAAKKRRQEIREELRLTREALRLYREGEESGRHGEDFL